MPYRNDLKWALCYIVVVAFVLNKLFHYLNKIPWCLMKTLMGYVSIEMAFEFDYWMINIIIRNDRVYRICIFLTLRNYT